MKVSFLFFLVLFTACTDSTPSTEEVNRLIPPLEVSDFCTEPSQILLHQYWQTSRTEDICFSEEKIELRLENTDANTNGNNMTSYLQQVYYLEEYSFEEVLAQINSYGLTIIPDISFELPAADSLGKTLQLSLEGEDPQVFIHQITAEHDPIIETNVEGDFSGLVQDLRQLIPSLTELEEVSSNPPYSPFEVEATSEAEQFIEKPFCASENTIQLASYTQSSGQDFLAAYLCLSEEKAELIMVNISRDIQVSYLRQDYYLEDYSFEDILNELKALEMEVTQPVSEVEMSEMGSCKSVQQITVFTPEEKLNWYRISSCGLEPEWQSNVEGDFETALSILQGIIPNWEDLSRVDENIPYPPAQP